MPLSFICVTCDAIIEPERMDICHNSCGTFCCAVCAQNYYTEEGEIKVGHNPICGEL